MKRYLLQWSAITFAVLLGVAIINWAVDPYGLYRVIEWPGFNEIKPSAANRGAMAKAYQVQRVLPQALILGNSRAEVGFDPAHSAWRQKDRPVMNLALPGTGTATSLRYLRHALSITAMDQSLPRIKTVVWGIDFMDFLVEPSAPNPASAVPIDDRRLRLGAPDVTDREHAFQLVRDHLEATVTMGALLDSVQTMSSQSNAFAVDLTPLGFNPMRDYLKIAADEGYRALFRQKNQAYSRSFVNRPTGLFRAGTQTSPAISDLQQIMQLCAQQGIELHLVTYPYHAHLLQTIRLTGHWQALLEWKRVVVRVVSEFNATHRTAFPLWDFAELNEITTEAVPVKDNKRTPMKWYWEAGHFKRELGHQVLNRVLGSSVGELGVALSLSNVEDRIAALNEQEVTYRVTHVADVEDIEKMVRDAQSRAKRRFVPPSGTVEGSP